MARACIMLLLLLFASVASLATSEARGEPAPRKSASDPHDPPGIQVHQGTESITPPRKPPTPMYMPWPPVVPNPPPQHRPPTFMYQNDSVVPKPPPRRPPTFMYQLDRVVPKPPPRRPPRIQSHEEPASITPPPHKPPTSMYQTDHVVPKPPPEVQAQEEPVSRTINY